MIKCLVVDDVEVTRFVTGEILEELGIQATIVKNIDEGLKEITSGNFDVILLDWHIGKDSGVEFLKKLRSEHHLKTPVVVFSGVENDAKSHEAISAGANAFLAKPTTKDKLENCFKNVGVAT